MPDKPTAVIAQFPTVAVPSSGHAGGRSLATCREGSRRSYQPAITTSVYLRVAIDDDGEHAASVDGISAPYVSPRTYAGVSDRTFRTLASPQSLLFVRSVGIVAAAPARLLLVKDFTRSR
jgi:hypothetical protein